MLFSRGKPCPAPGLPPRDTALELSCSILPWWCLPYYTRQREKYTEENSDMTCVVHRLCKIIHMGRNCVKRKDAWFVPLYDGLRPAIVGMARRYARTWGLDADDLIQIAGYALWSCCGRYQGRPLDEQLRIGNTVARRTMLHWCDHEGRTPTHLGTAGTSPWFTAGTGEAFLSPQEEQ